MFFFSSRRRHTRCALVTGVQTCALPIYTNRGPLMNRTFRKVWSRARGTVVVASELAKRRGAGARATQTNRGVGIGLLALALAATGSVYAQAPAVAQKPDATSAESISKDRKSTRLNSSH